tara:strand:+ start:187 stop:414 length:228 start_codon:yes stop_codon:yes gene_type:complete
MVLGANSGAAPLQGARPPSKVIGLENDKVEVLASGVSCSCVLTGKGGVECWGDKRFGQLGNGTIDNGSRAVFVAE